MRGSIRNPFLQLHGAHSAVLLCTAPRTRHSTAVCGSRHLVRFAAVDSWSTSYNSTTSGNADQHAANPGAGLHGNSNFSTGAPPGQQDTSGWNQHKVYAEQTSTSSWQEDSASAWPASADWGQTVNIGDWGEAPSVTPSSPFSSNGQAQATGSSDQQGDYDAAGSQAYGDSNGYSHSDGANAGSAARSSNPFTANGDAGDMYSTDQPYASSGHQYTFNESSDFQGYTFEQQQQQQQQQGQAGYDNSWQFANAFADAQQQQQQQSFQAAAGMPPLMPSDITLIGRRDADSMLPITPSTEQARYYQPRTLSERLVQIMGSFGVSVVLSKSAVLAGPALLYPVWGPWIRAGIRNLQMYLRQFKCVGLWRAEVLSVQLNTIPYAYRQTGAAGDSITITVGDPWQGGARTELMFPYQPGCEDIVEGEPAELLVLCQDDKFFNFKVVREVYLPQSGMWLSEYPFVDRDVFLDVSLAIERARQTAAAAGGTTATAAGGYQRYGSYQVPTSQAVSAPPTPPSGAAAVDYRGMGWIDVDAAVGGPLPASDKGDQGFVADSGSSSAATSQGIDGSFIGTSFSGYDTSGGGASNTATSSGAADLYSASTYGPYSNLPSSETAGGPFGDPAAADALLGEFVGVASQLSSQVGTAAAQVTGAATQAASDMVSGVTGGVAAGMGWFNKSAAPGSSAGNHDSNADNAVVPDVIIDNQGVWSPMGEGVGISGRYGPGVAYSAGRSGQQWDGVMYGQGYMDQPYTGTYQQENSSFDPSSYTGYSSYCQAGPTTAGPSRYGTYSTGFSSSTSAGFTTEYGAGYTGTNGHEGAGNYSTEQWSAPPEAPRASAAHDGAMQSQAVRQSTVGMESSKVLRWKQSTGM